MAAGVTFKDYSIEVTEALDETTIAWLLEAANEVTSQAQRTCVMEDDVGKRLKGSYKNAVDGRSGVAQIGTPLEEGYWEEFGTGEYAAHGDGRKGWWIFIRGEASKGGGQSYATQEEAEEAAAFLRTVKGLDAVVTNGRPPNYTLERAFEAKQGWAKDRLADMLKERMDK